MRLFSTKEHTGFNAVIEGALYENWMVANYKITQINVPKTTTRLNDRLLKYSLYGITKDFENIHIVGDEKEVLETKLDFLGSCEGILLSKKGKSPNRLDRPRIVCMRDGRIYLNQHMLNSKHYLGKIPLFINTIGEIFKQKKFSELYHRAVKS